MKWFKHFSDAYTNLKLQEVFRQFGLEGYGLYWLCLELIAQQGDEFVVKKEKNWKNFLIFQTKLDEKKIETILNLFADLGLIDIKYLKKGHLYTGKMKEYADEYTFRKMAKSPDSVPTVSRQHRDFVRLEEEGEEEEEEEQKEREIQPSAPTPKKIAILFFEGDQEIQKQVLEWVLKHGVPHETAERELKKFINYWTELNPSGKKQRWELQKTFEVNRRLVTWFTNFDKFSGIATESKGVTV